MAKVGAAGGLKRAEQIADRIEQRIVEEDLRAGACLGTEAELTAQLGVSRAVLREALVLVASSGLARIRRNRGLVVEPPLRENAAAALLAHLELLIDDVEEIWLLRACIESLAVALAIFRASAIDLADIEALIASVDRAPTPTAVKDLTSDTTQRLVVAAHNSWLSGLSEALSRLTFIHTLRTTFDASPPLSYAELAKLRQAQARAVISADLRAALAATDHIFKFFHSGPNIHYADAGQLDAATRRSQPTQGGRWKLGQVLAEKLRQEIALQGLVEGSSMGAETELMKAHSVGRATLREAIRILERLGRVKMVRGRGGGLIVTEPDPARIARNILIHLRRMDVQRHETVEFASELSLCIAGAVCRMADADKEPLRELRASFFNDRDRFSSGAMLRLMRKLSDAAGLRGFGLMIYLSESLLDVPDLPDTNDRSDEAKAIVDKLFDRIMQGDEAGARTAVQRLNRTVLSSGNSPVLQG